MGQFGITKAQEEKRNEWLEDINSQLEDRMTELEEELDAPKVTTKRKLITNYTEQTPGNKVKRENLRDTKPLPRPTRKTLKKPRVDEAMTDDTIIELSSGSAESSQEDSPTDEGKGVSTQDYTPENESPLPPTPNIPVLVNVQGEELRRSPRRNRVRHTGDRRRPAANKLHLADTSPDHEKGTKSGHENSTPGTLTKTEGIKSPKFNSETEVSEVTTTEPQADKNESENVNTSAPARRTSELYKFDNKTDKSCSKKTNTRSNTDRQTDHDSNKDSDQKMTSSSRPTKSSGNAQSVLPNNREEVVTGPAKETCSETPRLTPNHSPDSFAGKSLRKEWTKRNNSGCEFEMTGPKAEGLGPHTTTDTSDDDEPNTDGPVNMEELDRCLNEVIGNDQPERRKEFKDRLLTNQPIIIIERRHEIVDFCRQLADRPERWYFHIGEERLRQREANNLAVYARYAGGEPGVINRTLLETSSVDTEWRASQNNEVGFFLDGLMRQYTSEGKGLRGRSDDRSGANLANGIIGLAKNGEHRLITYPGTNHSFRQEQEEAAYQRNLTTPNRVLKKMGRNPTASILILVTDETEARMKEKCDLPRLMRKSDAKNTDNSGHGHLKVRFGAKAKWEEHIARIPGPNRDYRGEKQEVTLEECGAFMVMVSPYGLQKVFWFDNMYQFNLYWLSQLVNQTTHFYQESLMLRFPSDYANTNSFGESMPQTLTEVLLPDQLSAIGFDLRRNGARAGLSAADNFSRIRMFVLAEVSQLLATEADDPGIRSKLRQIEEWTRKTTQETMPEAGPNKFIAATPNNKIQK